MSNVLQFPKIDYWGGCPVCRRNDGCVSVGPDHWYVCHRHKTKWLIGSNLFSIWRHLTEEEHMRNFYRLSTYRKVTPLLEEAPAHELEGRELVPFCPRDDATPEQLIDGSSWPEHIRRSMWINPRRRTESYDGPDSDEPPRKRDARWPGEGPAGDFDPDTCPF
jgi:hypothetical protein